MTTLLSDARHALRSALRRPGVPLVVVLTLAVGIGANVAMFSAFHEALIRPLPYVEPERLVLGRATFGGNINPEGVSMFEPIGGSAPKYTGQNVINPLAAIMAGHMMLSFLGQTEAAGVIEKAVMKTIENHMKSMEAGKMGIGTREVGDLVVKYIQGKNI